MAPAAARALRVLLALAGASSAAADIYFPQMIHLSLTGQDGEMAVDWISSCPDGSSAVTFADNPAHTNATSAPGVDHASAYVDLHMTHTNYTLHYALMTGLRPGTMYYYKVGCSNMSSQALSLACSSSMSVSACAGRRSIRVSAASANAVVCSWSCSCSTGGPECGSKLCARYSPEAASWKRLIVAAQSSFSASVRLSCPSTKSDISVSVLP